MSRDANSTDFARSEASRNGSKSVASSACTALLIHGFSPFNARLLITCDSAFYAIIACKIQALFTN